MQRRAAAVYFALFVVVGAGTFAFIQVGTTHPDVSLQADELESGQSLTVDGVDYTVSSIERSGGDGGDHGGGGGGSLAGELQWRNESAVATAELANNSTVAYQGGDYRVFIQNQSDVSEFSLIEQFDVSAILAADDAVEDQVATSNGTRYVVYRSNQSLAPLETYLPDPTTAGPFAEGDTVEYQAEEGNVSATVRNVTAQRALLAWDSPQNETIDLSEGGNVTLGDTQYFAHFTDEEHVQLVSTEQYWDAYQEEREYESAWFERHAGLWAVVIASFLAAIILLSAAYMPVRS
jgi:hypothetical protein